VNPSGRLKIQLEQNDPSLAFEILATPGGNTRLRRQGDQLVADDGRSFPIENGIVRMLESVDAALAAELASQYAAREIYLDNRLVVMRFQRTLGRILVQDMLGGIRGKLLEAGCGVGLLGSTYPDLDLYGVDASFSLLTEAKRGYQLRIECSAEELPFAKSSFDAVLAMNMLHHVIEPKRAIREFARVLKPGGLVVALDPRKVALIEMAKAALRGTDSAFAESHTAFSLDEYRELVRDSGTFEVQEIRCVGLLAPIVVGVLERFRRVSRHFPAPDATLTCLMKTDEILSILKPVLPKGLNMAIRARKR
jgi:ubiquinone/menaquinone biosynthesis C-methylase UbiE